MGLIDFLQKRRERKVKENFLRQRVRMVEFYNLDKAFDKTISELTGSHANIKQIEADIGQAGPSKYLGLDDGINYLTSSILRQQVYDDMLKVYNWKGASVHDLVNFLKKQAELLPRKYEPELIPAYDFHISTARPEAELYFIANKSAGSGLSWQGLHRTICEVELGKIYF